MRECKGMNKGSRMIIKKGRKEGKEEERIIMMKLLIKMKEERKVIRKK